MQKRLVGVDGCKGGWIAVAERGEEMRVELWDNLAPIFEESWSFACVDIPIGFLPGKERRECDVEARKLLAQNRSSIFFSPPREDLEARSYEEVRTRGMSLQTFYLLPKIREMEHRIEPTHQSFLKEAHPELAYRTRAAAELAKKKTKLGRTQRQEILTRLGSPFRLTDWEKKFMRRSVALDDLLDAAILLEVAREWGEGVGRRVGGRQRDSRGLKMEICY